MVFAFAEFISVINLSSMTTRLIRTLLNKSYSTSQHTSCNDYEKIYIYKNKKLYSKRLYVAEIMYAESLEAATGGVL